MGDVRMHGQAKVYNEKQGIDRDGIDEAKIDSDYSRESAFNFNVAICTNTIIATQSF